jgi:predicted NBD/HSP70 family sugar kinase
VPEKTSWGIDLGGTKIEGVVMDRESRAILARLRASTEAAGGYEHILDRISGVVVDLEKESGLRRPGRIGVGTPGSSDPASGLMRNCNTTVLNGRPLHTDLENTLGVDVRLANDANCFALAEATMGAGKGYGVVFGVITGTGVGGGIVVDGRVLDGLNGIAGEWGHNELEPNGEPCYCGKKGCVETVLSGPALERYYERLTGRSLPLSQIAASDEPAAMDTMSRLVSMFGKACSVVVNILDPDVIILGGGVGNVPYFTQNAVDSLKGWVFHDRPATPVIRPMLGDSAGVFGAAILTD